MNPSVNNDKVKALSADLQPLLLVTAPLTNVLLNKCADYDRYVIVYPKAPLTCKSDVDWGARSRQNCLYAAEIRKSKFRGELDDRICVL